MPKDEVMLAMADSLGLVLKVKDGKVSAGEKKSIRISDLFLNINPIVVSSHVGPDGAALLLKVVGRVGLYLAGNTDTGLLEAAVLDCDKGSLRLPDLFENAKPRELAEARSLIDAHSVVSFCKDFNDDEWTEIADIC